MIKSKIDIDKINQEIDKNIGVSFNNNKLLIEALVHPSFKHENPEFKTDNQRLEFLGDAVLNMVITDLLFDYYKNATEGILTQMRISLVKEEMLYKKAKSLGLDKLILLGTGEEKQGGRDKPSILCDLFEAFIGALYLDKGYNFVKEFIWRIFEVDIKNINLEVDWKNLLRSLLLKEGKEPQYKVVKEEGPEHNKTFYVELWIDGEKLAEGMGKNKREAEIMAAKEGLKKIKNDIS